MAALLFLACARSCRSRSVRQPCWALGRATGDQMRTRSRRLRTV